jgi:hypothetical protein
MDEHEGFFRIATTQMPTWSWFMLEDDVGEPRTSSSAVYVLDQSLKIVGSVEGLGKGEQIYSVRFIGPRGYVVTFRQIDPLFVLDLKDPSSPTVLGELKVPGFSTYLHPYDDATIIGLGRGENGAMKLSLFDVSTPSVVKELDSYSFGSRGSDSPALSDHKAFLFSLGKRLLVLPVTERGQDYGSASFQGAVVFDVTRENGFRERGRVAHGEISSPSGVSGIVGSGSDAAPVKRVRYLNDALYTISNRFAQANDLGNLSFLRRLELAGGASSPVSPLSSYPGAERSRDAKRVADIKQIQTALELYIQDQDRGSYPVKGTRAAPVILGSPGNTRIVHNGTTYMGVVPANPTPGGAPYRYRSTDGRGGDCTVAPCAGYELTFSLESKTGSLEQGEHTATPNGIR